MKPGGGCQRRLAADQQVLPKGMENEVWSCYFGMHPEPNATVQGRLLGEFDVGAAVEQKRELSGFSFGVLEKFEDCKPHKKWVSHSHRSEVFPPSLPDFPFLYFPLPPLWTCCIHPLDTQGEFFSPSITVTFIFQTLHLYPYPFSFIKYCQFLVGVCMAQLQPALPGLFLPLSRTEAVGQHHCLSHVTLCLWWLSSS